MELRTRSPGPILLQLQVAAVAVDLALDFCLERETVAPSRAVETMTQNLSPARIQNLGTLQLLEAITLGL